jgi:broad specificity phosphatase PhoE
MSKKLIALLQRHGDTEANDENVYRSRLDPSLNDKGIKQAEAAARDIAKHHGKEIKKVVSSPMLRAVQTADIIAEKLGLEVVQDRSLIAWNLGFLSGKNKDVYKDILDFYIDNPEKEIPEGESLDELTTRLEEYFDKEFRNEDELGVYVMHNSNLVTVENLVTGTKDRRQESSEKSVEPGGTMGVYLEDDGKYSVEVLFGVENSAEYTS